MGAKHSTKNTEGKDVDNTTSKTKSEEDVQIKKHEEAPAERPKSQAITIEPQNVNGLARGASNLSVTVPPNSLEGYAHKMDTTNDTKTKSTAITSGHSEYPQSNL